MLKNFLLNRLKEPSTWRGIVALLTASGIALRPDQVALIITIGTALCGLIGTFMPDAQTEKIEQPVAGPELAG